MKYKSEYRINKKGAECFRTTDSEEAHAKFKELSAKRPGIYTMQSRTVYLTQHGVELTDSSGRPLWSAWS